MSTTQENLERQNLKKLRQKTVKIFGPPGTGKTETLISRVLNRALQNKISPQEIAFISFTNKAINTATARALDAFPQYTSEDFYRFKTLHKYCRRYFEEDIFDPKDCMVDFALEGKIIKYSDKRLADDNFMYKDWSLGIYSKARNMMKSPQEVYKKESYQRDSLDVLLKKIQIYEDYKKVGKEKALIDFDDMIGRAIEEVSFPPLKILIIDEAQDCTPLQWSVIYKLAQNTRRIYLAGDDDQAIYEWNGADPKYFTRYFPGRKVKLRKTRRFGKAIHHLSQIIRREIFNSEEKEYSYLKKEGFIKHYLNFREIPFHTLPGSWYILGRINTAVNELRMLAKDAGLYFSDNEDIKCFDQHQWEAIKAWTHLSNKKTINKKQAEKMYRYIRELKDPRFRASKFWNSESELEEYDFKKLTEHCGLDLSLIFQKKQWWHILKRNFTSQQVLYFLRLLKRYGQKELDNPPNIIIDTIHSVKGGEADHVVLYSKANYPSNFRTKSRDEKTNEKKVWYTGATRARKTIHLLDTNYKYNYPIGGDYLTYVQER
jgi:superfamily I DNA/RNA helicase